MQLVASSAYQVTVTSLPHHCTLNWLLSHAGRFTHLSAAHSSIPQAQSEPDEGPFDHLTVVHPQKAQLPKMAS